MDMSAEEQAAARAEYEAMMEMTAEELAESHKRIRL